jgi:drug/metabolite transporter (DMT)-like permease
MTNAPNAVLCHRPARWSLVLAFTLVYLSWGTTYLAIKKGVEAFPPCLFGGVRVAAAGLVLLAFLFLRGKSIVASAREFMWTGVVGLLMFVGGNGLITYAEQSVASGVASVLAATSPFCVALLELMWPRGERLGGRGWLGLLIGLGGVVVLLAPSLQPPIAVWQAPGPLLVLGSAMAWALGSIILRRRRLCIDHLLAAAYQMIVGGGTTVLIGLALGEGSRLSSHQFTAHSVYSFFHLLVVGSLIGFVAYNWLLGNVSATLAATYAYVNPVVAILLGWQLNGEPITIWIAGGMAIILTGVALVRGGTALAPKTSSALPSDIAERTAHPQARGPVVLSGANPIRTVSVKQGTCKPVKASSAG